MTDETVVTPVQENGQVKEPQKDSATHYAIPVPVFQDVLRRIIGLPYFLRETIEAITTLLEKNTVPITVKTNTNDQENQTALDGK